MPSSVRPSRRSRRLLLGGVAALVSLLLAELVVRLVVPPGRWLDEERLDFFVTQATIASDCLQPDEELGHVPLLGGRSHDEFGLLREEAPTPIVVKPAGTHRVLFLGDSVTARRQIVLPLRALWRGGAVEFLNAGYEGANPVQSVELYFRHQRQLAPDQVVLTLHNNDLTVTTTCLRDAGGTMRICNPHNLQALSAPLYRWSALYRLWFSAGYRDYMGDAHYLDLADDVAAALRRLRDDLVSRGARLDILLLPILSDPTYWNTHQTASRERELKMLGELGTFAVDLLPASEELRKAKVRIVQGPDDIWHPGSESGAWFALTAVRAGLFPAAPEFAKAAATTIDAGGAQRIAIDAGEACGGAAFAVIGSKAGLQPPVEVYGVGFPLIPDEYMGTTVQSGPPYRGQLDAKGCAVVDLPAPALQVDAGLLCWHVILVEPKQGPRQLSRPVPMIVRGP
ncbi:MAG TPA: SGNH/GDSL hydrolase family protein [Planctomycetota bacterium]